MGPHPIRRVRTSSPPPAARDAAHVTHHCRHRPAHARNRQSPRRRHVSRLRHRGARAARGHQRSALPAHRVRRRPSRHGFGYRGRRRPHRRQSQQSHRTVSLAVDPARPRAGRLRTCARQRAPHFDLRHSRFARARHRRQFRLPARSGVLRRQHGRKSAPRIHPGHEPGRYRLGLHRRRNPAHPHAAQQRKLGLRQAHAGGRAHLCLDAPRPDLENHAARAPPARPFPARSASPATAS